MAIKAKPNGEPGTLQLHLGWLEQAVLGTIIALLTCGLTSTILMWRDVAILRNDLSSHIESTRNNIQALERRSDSVDLRLTLNSSRLQRLETCAEMSGKALPALPPVPR